MVETNLFSLIALGFGMGLLHATDADHVIAVTGLSAGGKPGFFSSVRYCLKWALGHGLVLMLVGVAVLVMGMAIPQSLSAWAESLVGVLLQIIGLWVLWDLYRNRLHVHPHRHEHTGNAHAHWHVHPVAPPAKAAQPHAASRHAHAHGAVLVGMVHGMAGSAPVLLLIPVANSRSVLEGLAYLLLFSIGVLLGMLGVGGLIGSAMGLASGRSDRLLTAVRGLAGVSSLGYGLFLMLHQA